MTTPKSLESVSVTISTSTAEIIQGIRTKTNLGLEIKDFTYVKKVEVIQLSTNHLHNGGPIMMEMKNPYCLVTL